MRYSGGAAAALGLCQFAFSQADSAPPAFEVAAIRRSMPLEELSRLAAAGRGPFVGILVRNDRIEIGFQTIGELIAAAYEVKPYQIAGPQWLIKEMNPLGQMGGNHVFNVQARMPKGAARSQMPAMLETLQKDRFGMASHRERRELPVYALRVAGEGAKLRPGTADSAPPPPATLTAGLDNGEQQTVQYVPHGSIVWADGFGKMKQTFDRTGLHIEASDLTMDRLAQMITPYFDWPVINATGMTGGYAAVIDIWLGRMAGGHAGGRCALHGIGLRGRRTGANDPFGDIASCESLKKLGLRVIPEKHMIDVIVVDHIEETPTEN